MCAWRVAITMRILWVSINLLTLNAANWHAITSGIDESFDTRKNNFQRLMASCPHYFFRIMHEQSFTAEYRSFFFISIVNLCLLGLFSFKFGFIFSNLCKTKHFVSDDALILCYYLSMPVLKEPSLLKVTIFSSLLPLFRRRSGNIDVLHNLTFWAFQSF